MNRIMLISISLILITSCKTATDKASETSNSETIEATWQAVRINGNPINRMVTVPIMNLNIQEMKINGTDGCNNYFGTISEMDKRQISFTQIGSTRKMCPDMDVPDLYLNSLNEITQYSMQGDILVFTNNINREVLAMMKINKE